jgi:DNA-binding ferritin-like protein (Dps family)
MKDEQRLLEISAAAARRGDAPHARRRKWREMETRLMRLKREYNQGHRDLTEYWEAVVHLIKNFV